MMLNKIAYVIEILAVLCASKGQCLPNAMTPPDTMTRSLFIFEKFLSAAEVFEQSQTVIKVLKDFNNMVAQLVEVNKQLSNGIEGSGAMTQIHEKELLATRTFLKASIQQACEWVKKDLFVDQELVDCSNENNSHDMINRALLYGEIFGLVETAIDSVDELGVDDSKITETSCRWFFCTFNPDCNGPVSTTAQNYEFMKNSIFGLCYTARLDLTSMNCNSACT